jgi:uncharacterized protein YndB with AHSA1/START domain
MPVDVASEIVIYRARAEVAAYASDPELASQWYTNVDEVEWRSEPRLQVGSRVAFVSYAGRKRTAFVFEVREYVPAERLVMRSVEGSFPMDTTYSWKDEGEHATRMTLRNRGEPTGLLKYVTPLLVPAMRRSIHKDLARLKRLLERGTTGRPELRQA